jgi:hypothetical protein
MIKKQMTELMAQDIDAWLKDASSPEYNMSKDDIRNLAREIYEVQLDAGLLDGTHIDGYGNPYSDYGEPATCQFLFALHIMREGGLLAYKNCLSETDPRPNSVFARKTVAAMEMAQKDHDQQRFSVQ